MRLCVFLGLVMAVSLHGQEVVLYDVDYTGLGDQVGQEIAVGQVAFPGRTVATELISGQATIENAPLGLSGTVALMVSEKETEASTFAYSQHGYWLFGGAVHVFRTNRIEVNFKIGSPELLAADEGLTIYTDGGVTNRLQFRGDGDVILNANEQDPVSGSLCSCDFSIGTFDPTQAVDLVWELDSGSGSSTVTINGVSVSVPGLGVRAVGFRNYALYPAPWQIRLRFSDADSESSLALQTFRVVGSDYDGPLYRTLGDPFPIFESGVVELPLLIPPTGTWQAEYSLDLENWVPFGVPLDASAPFDGVLCAKVGDLGMYLRLVEVE